MKCPRCQHENRAAAKFCDECATLLTALGLDSPHVQSYAEVANALSDALDQQAATAEILKVISSSPTDAQPVFDAIAQNAARLCSANDAQVLRVDGEVLRLVAAFGAPSMPPVRRLTRGHLVGRAVIDRKTIHVRDLAQALREYPETTAPSFNVQSTLAVPLLHEGVALGVIRISRTEVRPFTDKQAALLQTFADQAIIAIENVRLFTELQTSNRDLTTALDTQTATSDILRVISRSQTDVQPVFQAIVDSAVHLLAAYSGTLTRIAGDQIELAAHTSTDDAGDAATRAAFPQPLSFGGVHAQTIRNRAPLNIADAQTDPRLPETSHTYAQVRGFRSQGAVPMLRHDEVVGAIAVARREPGGFTDDEIALLQTFADQAVIAIENVRLFTELQEKNRALTQAHAQVSEALEQQTATAEILRVISGSQTDIQPVFDTIVKSAAQLCDGVFATLFRFDGELLHWMSQHNSTPEGIEAMQRRWPRPPGPETIIGRAVIARTVIHVRDSESDPDAPVETREIARAFGYRSVVSVPMLREGQPVGGLSVARRDQPFTPAQISLLQTFADQAVIAIENVRLFTELEARNREIEDKSRQLEAASQHKSEFLANMSHELRTPLNAVIGFSEVLAERMFGELNEKQDEYLRDIYASGQHLLSLINDILDLSKVEAGRMELELTDFHLPAALDNAMTLVRERAARRGIVLHMSIDERLGQVRADERKIRAGCPEPVVERDQVHARGRQHQRPRDAW